MKQVFFWQLAELVWALVMISGLQALIHTQILAGSALEAAQGSTNSRSESAYSSTYETVGFLMLAYHV